MMGSISLFRPPEHDWATDINSEVLTKIYDEHISVAIWQRAIPADVENYLVALLQTGKRFSLKCSLRLDQLIGEVQRVFPPVIFTQADHCVSAAAFYEDVHQVVDMFSCLFDAKILGLRMDTLDRAMCPRFHTDKVIVRLITTYRGPGTEWLPSAFADRQALSTDRASQVGAPGALIQDESSIQRMKAGDVALLKGESWEGNEERGAIHRSPALDCAGAKRLVLTCDVIV